MNRTEIVELVVIAIRDSLLPESGIAPEVVDENTPLFGKQGIFDSMGLVSLLLEIEQQVNNRLGISIVIADERAMSQSRSPFRSVASLVDYLWLLVQEQEGG